MKNLQTLGGWAVGIISTCMLVIPPAQADDPVWKHTYSTGVLVPIGNSQSSVNEYAYDGARNFSYSCPQGPLQAQSCLYTNSYGDFLITGPNNENVLHVPGVRAPVNGSSYGILVRVGGPNQFVWVNVGPHDPTQAVSSAILNAPWTLTTDATVTSTFTGTIGTTSYTAGQRVATVPLTTLAPPSAVAPSGYGTSTILGKILTNSVVATPGGPPVETYWLLGASTERVIAKALLSVASNGQVSLVPAGVFYPSAYPSISASVAAAGTSIGKGFTYTELRRPNGTAEGYIIGSFIVRTSTMQLAGTLAELSTGLGSIGTPPENMAEGTIVVRRGNEDWGFTGLNNSPVVAYTFAPNADGSQVHVNFKWVSSVTSGIPISYGRVFGAPVGMGNLLVMGNNGVGGAYRLDGQQVAISPAASTGDYLWNSRWGDVDWLTNPNAGGRPGYKYTAFGITNNVLAAPTPTSTSFYLYTGGAAITPAYSSTPAPFGFSTWLAAPYNLYGGIARNATPTAVAFDPQGRFTMRMLVTHNAATVAEWASPSESFSLNPATQAQKDILLCQIQSCNRNRSTDMTEVDRALLGADLSPIGSGTPNATGVRPTMRPEITDPQHISLHIHGAANAPGVILIGQGTGDATNVPGIGPVYIKLTQPTGTTFFSTNAQGNADVTYGLPTAPGTICAQAGTSSSAGVELTPTWCLTN